MRTPRAGGTVGGPRRRDQRGAAIVETAIVLPVLLAIIFGILTYGYMFSFRQALSQAAAEGARAGALASSDPAGKARASINDALAPYGVSCTSGGTLVNDGAPAGTCVVSAAATCTSTTSGSSCLRVTLDYGYRAHPLVPAVPLLGATYPEHLRYQTEVRLP